MNFIKIYLWQIISIVFNFATVFIVTPYLSSNPAIFGIYSVVTAAYIFLSYADFGFLSAGMKYASESIAKNDRVSEIRLIGFSGFIFLVFVILFSIVMLFIAFNPNYLVKNISDGVEYETAQKLLFTLAIFAPVYVVQRMLLIVYAIRLEDYKFQRILILFNIVKILSVFYFFSNNSYNIVGYFVFSQICNLLGVLVGLYLIKRNLNYDLSLLYRSLQFSKELFSKTKKLAFSSIFLTVCWILYYELDPFVIGKMFGSSKVAVFAIGLTLMSYFRSIFGIFFSPFIVKFNHYIGTGDYEGLKSTFVRLLVLTIPITVFPVVSFAITAKSFIFSWVGAEYFESIQIAQLLILCYLFSFLTYPSGILIMAYEKVKLLYITSAILPIIFWIGIAITSSYFGLISFAIFKFIAFTISAISFFVITHFVLKLNSYSNFLKIIWPALVSVLFLIILSLIFNKYMPYDKSKLNLILCISINGLLISISTIIYFIVSKSFRLETKQLLSILKLKIS